MDFDLGAEWFSPDEGYDRKPVDDEELRLVKLVDLLKRSGDADAAAVYQAKLETHRQKTADSGVTVEFAEAQQDHAEEALQKAIAKFERLDKLLDAAQQAAGTCESELDAARARCQAAVRRLHDAVVKVEEDEAPAAPSAAAAGPPKFAFTRLLEGDELVLDDGNLFGIEELGEEVFEQDRQGA